MAETAPDIIDLVTRHGIGVARYSSTVNRRIRSLLNDAEADIIKQLQARAGFSASGAMMSSKETDRLNRLLETIRLINKEAYAAIYKDLPGELTDLAEFETEFTRDMTAAVSTVTNFRVPSRQQLRSMAMSQPFQGQHLKEWASGMETATMTRLKSAIRMGVVQGESTDQIIRRVRGTKAKKYADGAMSISKRGAESVVRTAVNHIQNRAHYLTITENPRIFARYRWVSTLDGRTSPICRGHAGKVFEVGKGPIPPAHWNCRSRIVGIPNGYEMESQPTYAEWLRKQSTGDVEDILGKTKARLFLEGDIPMDGFVNRAGDELTLSQLKDRHAALFRDLGIK